EYRPGTSPQHGQFRDPGLSRRDESPGTGRPHARRSRDCRAVGVACDTQGAVVVGDVAPATSAPERFVELTHSPRRRALHHRAAVVVTTSTAPSTCSETSDSGTPSTYCSDP